MLRALFYYRSFIYESIKREFYVRYANSILGSLWAVFNPLSMIIVYTLIFSQIMAAKLPGVDSSFAYSVYLCSGVLPWGFFTEVSNRSVTMFIDNAGFLKKVRIPKICLPAIVFGTALVNFTIVFVLFVIFLLLVGLFPGWNILYAIPLLMLLSAISLSIGIFLGTINVFFRDISQIYGILIQFWFWLTPIVYPAAIIPKKLSFLLNYNPMYMIMDKFHKIFVERVDPNLLSLLPLAICVVLFSLYTLYFFRKHSEEIVDEL